MLGGFLAILQPSPGGRAILTLEEAEGGIELKFLNREKVKYYQ